MNNDLYIPMGLKSDKEVIQGFGMKEFILMGFCVAVALIVGALIWMIFSSSTVSLFVGMAIFLTGILLFRKNENTNQSFLDLIIHMVDYLKGVKHFKYVHLNEWEI
jgi:hypothetical protein